MHLVRTMDRSNVFPLHCFPISRFSIIPYTVLIHSNIVGTIQLKKPVQLEEAVNKLRNAEYNPKVESHSYF